MKFNLFHYVKIEIESKYKTLAINILLQQGVSYKSSINSKTNSIVLLIHNKDFKCLKKEFKSNNVDYKILKHIGLCHQIYKNRFRFGIIIGIVILIFSVYLNSKFLWKIEVVGNDLLTKEEVLEILDKNGFSLGTFIPKINYDKLQNDILLNEDRISWISLNITGNIAKVHIKETISIEETKEKYYSNIVAQEDGQIVEIKNIGGKRVVSKNDIVKKGQLLISGVIDSQSEGVRYEQAKGEVLATVNKNFFVEIPFTYDKKDYTGKVYTQKKYKIFSFIINFSLNNNKYNKKYDKIESKKTVKLFGTIELPITVYTTKYYEYEVVSSKRSTEEATEQAIKELNSMIKAEAIDSRILSKSINTNVKSKSVLITCEMLYITNIAREVKITVN